MDGLQLAARGDREGRARVDRREARARPDDLHLVAVAVDGDRERRADRDAVRAVGEGRRDEDRDHVAGRPVDEHLRRRLEVAGRARGDLLVGRQVDRDQVRPGSGRRPSGRCPRRPARTPGRPGMLRDVHRQRAADP